MRRARVIGSLACGLLLAGSTGAWGQKRLVLGLYAPSMSSLSRVERIREIESLAKQLSRQIGQPVSGQSFARGDDLTRAAKQRRVQIAIVSAQFAAENKWEPFAALKRGSVATESWTIVASGAVSSLRDLKGKTLVIPRTGRNDRRFVSNVLLEGEVDPSYFNWLLAPDTQSAVRAVKLGKAAAAALPSTAPTGGLKKVFVASGVPAPAAVFISRVPNATRKAIIDAMLKMGQVLGYAGFRAVKNSTYTGLRQQLLAKAKRKRPIPPRQRPMALAQRDVWTVGKLPIDLPSPLELVTTPRTRPDDFE